MRLEHGAGGSTGTHVLPHKPNLQGKDVRANWNAVALAFLGDSVWEVCFGKNLLHMWVTLLPLCFVDTDDRLHMQLYARRRYFSPPKKTSQYYDMVTAEVRAETQVPRVTCMANNQAGPEFGTPGAFCCIGNAITNVCNTLMR